MNWLRELFLRSKPSLTPAQAEALRAWRALPEPDPRRALGETRWVVLDVESSGLDARRDRLISIGAVAVHGDVLHLTDGFEVVLRQVAVSRTDNILVHGIGGTAQRGGATAADALLDFLGYADKSPIAAFHAAFDTIMIGRALREFLGLKWAPRVIDLADVMPALFPDIRGCRQLDDWLERFGIGHYARHQALPDAYATAQLLQVALVAATAQGCRDWGDLARIERAQRSLSRMRAVS